MMSTAAALVPDGSLDKLLLHSINSASAGTLPEGAVNEYDAVAHILSKHYPGSGKHALL